MNTFQPIANPCTVLLVDDQAIVAKLIQNMLSEYENVTFHYCPRASMAIAEIETIQPTVLLLDLTMPEVSGIELLKRLRSNDKTRALPVIVLSTEDSPASKKESFENGANDYLVKLPDKVELIARLRYHSQAYVNKQQRDEILVLLENTLVELEKRNYELLALSNIDVMTQLANRRLLDEKLQTELKRAARHSHPLGLIMLDVDHFKLYNDHYGHLQGDECLKAVALAIKACVKRPADLAARYGGEEFVILLPETELPGVVKIAEDIRQTIMEAKIPHEKSLTAACVTASLGAFSGIPTTDDTPESLLKLADTLLYHSKENGRNQVSSNPLQ